MPLRLPLGTHPQRVTPLLRAAATSARAASARSASTTRTCRARMCAHRVAALCAVRDASCVADGVAALRAVEAGMHLACRRAADLLWPACALAASVCRHQPRALLLADCDPIRCCCSAAVPRRAQDEHPGERGLRAAARARLERALRLVSEPARLSIAPIVRVSWFVLVRAFAAWWCCRVSCCALLTLVV